MNIKLKLHRLKRWSMTIERETAGQIIVLSSLAVLYLSALAFLLGAINLMGVME